MFLFLKLRAMNPSILLAVLQLFSVCFCHLRSVVMMIPRSRCDLLSATVHVVVSDVHHRTFIYIETHLPLFPPLIEFIDIFL